MNTKICKLITECVRKNQIPIASVINYDVIKHTNKEPITDGNRYDVTSPIYYIVDFDINIK